MNIYTSYFANIKNLPSNLVKISITAKRPAFFSGLQYVQVAPKYEFFMQWKRNKDNNFYIEHYEKEVLQQLDPQTVYKDLYTLSKGEDCVLLCYESSEKFCHRHLLAEWLNANLDIEVKEWLR